MPPGQGPIELGQRLAPLSLGLRIDQVRHRLGLGQVQLAVLERPAGEFARLGQPQAQPEQGVGYGIHHRAAAVQLQLRAVLAGDAGGAGKPEHEGLIEPGLGRWVAKGSQGCFTWNNRPARQGRQGYARTRTRQPHDGDRGPTGGGGQSENGVRHQLRAD